jgi:hypothetical protein
MALISILEKPLHPGEWGFRFRVDPELDRKLYEACVALESARLVPGSFVNLMYETFAPSRPSASDDAK